MEKVQRGDRDVREPKLEYHQVSFLKNVHYFQVFVRIEILRWKVIFESVLQFYSSPWAATLDDEKTHLTLTQRMRVR